MMQTETIARPGLTSKRVSVATAGSTLLVTAATGQKVYVTALWIYNDHTAANVATVSQYNSTTSTVILEYGLPAGNGVAMNAGSGEPILITPAGDGLHASWDTDDSPISLTYYQA